MRWLDKLLMQLKMLLRRDRAGKQLEDELQFHLDQQVAENLAAGMSAEEARRCSSAELRQSRRHARSGARYLELAVARTTAL